MANIPRGPGALWDTSTDGEGWWGRKIELSGGVLLAYTLCKHHGCRPARPFDNGRKEAKDRAIL